MNPRRTAGLSLSVGSASVPVRCFLAAMFGLFGLLCLAAAVIISNTGPLIAAIVAVVAIVPFGCVGIIAAVYTLAPFSRFGLWLDVFVGNLTWLKLAGVFLLFWLIGAALIFTVPLLRPSSI